MAEAAMDIASGRVDGLLNMLMNMEMSEPSPIWIAPIKADAVPAFFAKGASVSEAVFGFTIPIQDSNKNKNAISTGRVSHPIPEANKKRALNTA